MLIFQVSHSQTNFGKVEQWLDNHISALGGRATIMIFKDGKVSYIATKNEMNRKQKMAGKLIARRQGKTQEEVLKDIGPDTKINIASCSKWLSAALVMTFVDEGKLKLEDSIGKYLPIMSRNGKGQITILQCLAHLTGIKPGGIKEDIKEFSSAKNMEEVMGLISERPMEADPGTAFHYSSVGLQIAAAVIEKISGKDFETLFSERIAKPCEMIQTDFGHKKVPLPAGGALSTATDYLHFLEMILQDGKYKGKSVLDKKSVALMQQNYASGKKVISSPAEAGNWGYGLGEWVMDGALGDKRSEAVTSPGLFGSFPFVDNKLKYAAVLFTLNMNNKGRHEKYSELKKLMDEAIQGLN
jgi:CubicO group peptidase (beta-lactamase class C family)